MTEILFAILKVLIICTVSLYLGKKTGLFNLNKVASVCALAIILVLFGAEIYSSFFRNDISLLVIFKSSFLNLNLDLSYGLRLFLATLLLGLLCSCCDVNFSLKTGGVRQMCTLAMLIALAVLLGIYGTFRIGSGIKVTTKFIPIFIAGVLFGPLWGGLAGAMADVIAFIMNPVGGGLIPQITVVEFLYGFTYGLVFFKVHSWSGYSTMMKIIFTILFHIFALNLCLTSYFLAPILNMTYRAAVMMRIPAALLNMAIQFVAIFALSKYIGVLRKTVK